MGHIEVSHKGVKNGCEKTVIVMIIHVNIVGGNNSVGDFGLASLGVDHKVFERSVYNCLEIHVQFEGEFLVNIGVGAVESEEDLQVAQVSIANNNALSGVKADGSVGVVFLELESDINNNIGTVFHLEFRENLGELGSETFVGNHLWHKGVTD